MSRSFMHILGSIGPTLASGVQAKDIVAALAPPIRAHGAPNALTKKPEEKKEVSAMVTQMVPGIIGAGAGAFLFRHSHPWLGALGGHALASTAHPLITGRGRKKAMYQLAVEGAGIGGALMWEKHPFFGWLAGTVAGVGATALFSDSPARELYDKWRSG